MKLCADGDTAAAVPVEEGLEAVVKHVEHELKKNSESFRAFLTYSKKNSLLKKKIKTFRVHLPT